MAVHLNKDEFLKPMDASRTKFGWNWPSGFGDEDF